MGGYMRQGRQVPERQGRTTLPGRDVQLARLSSRTRGCDGVIPVPGRPRLLGARRSTSHRHGGSGSLLRLQPTLSSLGADVHAADVEHIDLHRNQAGQQEAGLELLSVYLAVQSVGGLEDAVCLKLGGQFVVAPFAKSHLLNKQTLGRHLQFLQSLRLRKWPVWRGHGCLCGEIGRLRLIFAS